MLRRQILSMIEAAPGVSVAALRASLPDAKLKQVHSAIKALRKAGAIEQARYGRYRLPASRPRPVAGATQTAPLARLMAGR